MRIKILFFFSVLIVTVSARAQKPVAADGPYVRYKDKQITVTQILRDDDLLYPATDNYSGRFTVTPEGHPEWAFQVKLKANIDTVPCSYPQTAKTLFLSDTEGEFKNLRDLLITCKVIDQQSNWTYGNGSLVIAGDLFDRGRDVTPQLWLLYKLEGEAKVQGGSVHLILGNHDLMNLSGDHRYTDARYFKHAWLLKTTPTGLFNKDTELGRWLRSKNIIEKIGDVLVTHGGLSPEVAGLNLSLQALNDKAKPYYDQKASAWSDTASVILGAKGLPWYRGYFREPEFSATALHHTLQRYGASAILVGHTILKWGIAMYYDGEVIAIDVDRHKGKNGAVLLEEGQWFMMDAKGKKHPVPQHDQTAVKESDLL